MSFASNRSAIRLGGVSRGRVTVGGGLKHGGFTIYGSSPRKHRSSGHWYDEIIAESNKAHRVQVREARRMLQRQADLDLKRQVRKKSGKWYDTEGMKLEQAKLDRYSKAKLYEEREKESVDKALIKSSLFFSMVLWLICLLFTPFVLLSVVALVVLFFVKTHNR